MTSENTPPTRSRWRRAYWLIPLVVAIGIGAFLLSDGLGATIAVHTGTAGTFTPADEQCRTRKDSSTGTRKAVCYWTGTFVDTSGKPVLADARTSTLRRDDAGRLNIRIGQPMPMYYADMPWSMKKVYHRDQASILWLLAAPAAAVTALLAAVWMRRLYGRRFTG